MKRDRKQSPTSAGAVPRRDIRESGGFLVSTLSGSHGLFHWVDQSLIVMLPEVKAAFGLSAVAIGAIAATERTAAGLISGPAGIATDMYRRYWGQVLAACMALFGLGWLVVGWSPTFPVLLVGIGLVAVASTITHLPGMAALSHKFPANRATVLGVHAIGGNVGDVIGPLVTTGILLGVLSWRGVFSVYALVPLALVLPVFWAYKNIGNVGTPQHTSPTLRSQLELTKRLLRSRALWGINLVSALRNMTFVSLLWFMPIYFDDELGMSFQARGFHVALFTLVGMFSTPVLGYLSDRVGRKQVLVPALVALCVLTLLLVPFGQGATLTVLVAFLSFFLYSDQPVLTAAALDLVGHRVANTTLGVLALTRLVPSAAAPVVAGWLYQDIGIHALFYFVAALFALSAVVMALVPLTRSSSRTIDEDV